MPKIERFWANHWRKVAKAIFWGISLAKAVFWIAAGLWVIRILPELLDAVGSVAVVEGQIGYMAAAVLLSVGRWIDRVPFVGREINILLRCIAGFFTFAFAIHLGEALGGGAALTSIVFLFLTTYVLARFCVYVFVPIFAIADDGWRLLEMRWLQSARASAACERGDA